ncbi:MAG: Asp23/Gls24 family envelope stress response protein [Symbiobacteriia bacterium]
MEVIALVGPSGTGKSHRASLVAYEYKADAIIDDGLLIKEARILAGESAKRESTMLAAVRRALFNDEEHASEVRRALHALQPWRLLVLGTSREMVNQICQTLAVPGPSRYVSIDEVASPADIKRARRVRREEGKHVIPAPTVEVKKTFSGYLIDPLRFLLSRPDESHDVWIEKSVVRPTYSSLGHFYIADTVLSAIATRAAQDTEGVARVLRAIIENSPRGVTLTIELSLRYGFPLMQVMEHVQAEVSRVVTQMTALNILAIDVEGRRLATD